jgi:hypothetical protein
MEVRRLFITVVGLGFERRNAPVASQFDYRKRAHHWNIYPNLHRIGMTMVNKGNTVTYTTLELSKSTNFPKNFRYNALKL